MVAFIENLKAESLSMCEDEFERYMSGELVPADQSDGYVCDGLRLMYQNLSMLSDLKQRHEKVMAEALQLQQEMTDFREKFKKEVRAVIARTPWTIKPRKTKVDLDAESPGQDLLPPPILPEVVETKNA